MIIRTPLVIGCVITQAAHIDRARQQSSDFLDGECGPGTNPPEKMLPIRLSPTGNAPATHFLCGARLWTAAQFERMQSFIAAQAVPVEAVPLAEGTPVEQAETSGTADRLGAALQAAFLESRGLKVVR